MENELILLKSIESELGTMTAGVINDKICLLEFENAARIKLQQERFRKLHHVEFRFGEHDIFIELEKQLTAYFKGKLMEFDLPLMMIGNAFVQSVWLKLLDIPYGKTSSYGSLAEALGDKAKVRAIGKANGANPIAILVPCHRVIGADGSLVGYAGELWRKQKLLNLEAFHSGAGVQLELGL